LGFNGVYFTACPADKWHSSRHEPTGRRWFRVVGANFVATRAARPPNDAALAVCLQATYTAHEPGKRWWYLANLPCKRLRIYLTFFNPCLPVVLLRGLLQVSRPSARPSMCPPTPLKRKRVSDRSRGSAWTGRVSNAHGCLVARGFVLVFLIIAVGVGPDLSPRPESCVKVWWLWEAPVYGLI
jgi:hypothetical protein